MEWPASGGALPNANTTPILLASGLPHTNAAQITADSFGNVYYADGTNLFMIPKNTATACTPSTCTSINNGITKPAGVTADQYNNLYVTDNNSNAIFLMPLRRLPSAPAS